MHYQFPATIFTTTNTISDQLQHIIGEMDEVKEAIDLALYDADSGTVFEHEEKLNAVEDEIADVYHSIETYWRVLDRVFGQGTAQKIKQRVIDKNTVRGYYDNLPGETSAA